MPKQILLVDDSVTIHRVVEITFAREDYQITALKSADEAINKAKDLRPVIEKLVTLSRRGAKDLHARRQALAQIKDADQVTNQVEQCVCPLLSGLVRLPIAAHIERDDVVASLSQDRDLLAPGVPEFGKAMTEQQERASPLLGHMYPQTVRFNTSMRHPIQVNRCVIRCHGIAPFPVKQLLPHSIQT